MEPNGKKLIGAPLDEKRYQHTAQNYKSLSGQRSKETKNKQCQCASISPLLDHNGPYNLDTGLFFVWHFRLIDGVHLLMLINANSMLFSFISDSAWQCRLINGSTGESLSLSASLQNLLVFLGLPIMMGGGLKRCQ